MIEYVEIRAKNTREIIGIIDGASSIIWHSVYFGVGDFEVYAQATEENLEMLVVGNYVTRHDDIEVGIIEKIETTNDIDNGLMIVASGRFAKSILDRRQIYNLSGTVNSPTILRGNVEDAVRTVVQKNMIACPFDNRRNISEFQLGANAGTTEIIVDDNGNATQKQVSYDNLLDYTDSVLEEYGLGATVTIDESNYKLSYSVYKGIDRSANNSSNESVIFSKEFDNLADTTYSKDVATFKNAILIGGEGEGFERFYSVIKGTQSGLERRETWLDASSVTKTLPADELQEIFPTGTFEDIYFKVNGTTYATIVADTEKEVSLSSLQEAFPSGVVSGTKFNVSGVTYANQIYGETDKYKYTSIGYKKSLDVEGEIGDYELTNTIYKQMLDALGKQELALLPILETFEGSLIVSGGVWHLNEDYMLGDIVTIQDNTLNLYADVRITEITETQDENGYSVEINYKN